MAIRFSLVLLLSFWSLSINADLKCDVDLNYGMVVNERQIRIIEESRTVYQINDSRQLIVMGNVVKLEQEQQKDLEYLANGVHYAVPKMIILATEGVELAVETMEHVYQGLVGTDHDSYEKLQSSLKKVQKRIRGKFIHANENFYIGPGQLENVNDLVDREIEEQLEQAINTSVGGVLSAIGGLTNGTDENPDQRLDNLSQRLEKMGQVIESKVGSKADSMRIKAQWFCNKMHHLDQAEERLRSSVPELAKFNVISSSATKRN